MEGTRCILVHILDCSHGDCGTNATGGQSSLSSVAVGWRSPFYCCCAWTVPPKAWPEVSILVEAALEQPQETPSLCTFYTFVLRSPWTHPYSITGLAVRLLPLGSSSDAQCIPNRGIQRQPQQSRDHKEGAPESEDSLGPMLTCPPCPSIAPVWLSG